MDHSEGFMMELLGFDDLPQDKALDKLLRSEMIDFLCKMGSEECLGRMHRKLKSHIDKEEKLPVNLESSVFCSGLLASAHSGEGTRLVFALWKEMQSSNNVEYRLRIIRALGCYADVGVLNDLLETILATNSEVQYLAAENFEIVQSIFANSLEGVEAVIDFMTRRKNDAIRRVQRSDLLEILLEHLPPKIADRRLQLKVLSRFFSTEDSLKFHFSSWTC